MSTAKDAMERRRELLEKIRSTYRAIESEFGLPKPGKQFEERYHSAEARHIADEAFFQNEIQLAREIQINLHGKTEQRELLLKKYFGGDERPDLSKKYPILESFDVGEADVAMLYSGIHNLLSQFWKPMKFYIEGTVQNRNLSNLERDLSAVYNEDIHPLPYNLRGYKSYLDNQPEHIHRLRRAQQTLQEAGIWLNSLSKILVLARMDQPMPPVVEEAEKLLHELIGDFRLKIFAERDTR